MATVGATFDIEPSYETQTTGSFRALKSHVLEMMLIGRVSVTAPPFLPAVLQLATYCWSASKGELLR